MLNHIKQNRFWLWKSLETYGLGVYFLIRSNVTFAFVPPRPTVLDIMDDPPSISILMIVATLAAVYSFWNIDVPYYKPVMTGALTFVWVFFMVAFIFHDVGNGQLLSFESMYAFFVLSSMIHEIVIGG